MATRNIVPRGNEEGNIGTSLKNWLKGWFKDLFVSGNLTDGSNDVTVAQLSAIAADDGYAESEGQSNTTSGSYQQKTRLSFTPAYTGDYLLMWSGEVAQDSLVSSTLVRLQQDDTTDLAEQRIEPKDNADWQPVGGIKKVSLTASQAYTFDIDYASTGNTSSIRRARVAIRKIGT